MYNDQITWLFVLIFLGVTAGGGGKGSAAAACQFFLRNVFRDAGVGEGRRPVWEVEEEEDEESKKVELLTEYMYM